MLRSFPAFLLLLITKREEGRFPSAHCFPEQRVSPAVEEDNREAFGTAHNLLCVNVSKPFFFVVNCNSPLSMPREGYQVYSEELIFSGSV